MIVVSCITRCNPLRAQSNEDMEINDYGKPAFNNINYIIKG